MDQLSKSFVMQHVHPSFRCRVERARCDTGQENLRSCTSLPFELELRCEKHRGHGCASCPHACLRRRYGLIKPNAVSRRSAATPGSGRASRRAAGLSGSRRPPFREDPSPMPEYELLSVTTRTRRVK
jgi:hypothetical protein